MFFVGWEMQYHKKSCSCGQLVTGSFITTMCSLMHHGSCRLSWWNVKSPRSLSPLQPRFGALQLLEFPQTKISFEREETSDLQQDSEKYYGAADGNWEKCVRSQGAYFEGTKVSLSYVQCFFYLVSFSVNVSVFHSAWVDSFWIDLLFTLMFIAVLFTIAKIWKQT